MKYLSSLRKPILSASIFFGTLGALSVGYATWTSMTGSYSAGDNLTATLWNNLVENVNDLDTRVTSTAADTQTALSFKADIASPTFSGAPKAPTQNNGTSDTTLATTAFVETRVASAAGSSYFGCYVSAAGSNTTTFFSSCIAGYTKVYSANVYRNNASPITFEAGYPPSPNVVYALGGTVNLSIQKNSSTYTTVILGGTDMYPDTNGMYAILWGQAYYGVALCCK